MAECRAGKVFVILPLNFLGHRQLRAGKWIGYGVGDDQNGLNGWMSKLIEDV